MIAPALTREQFDKMMENQAAWELAQEQKHEADRALAWYANELEIALQQYVYALDLDSPHLKALAAETRHRATVVVAATLESIYQSGGAA